MYKKQPCDDAYRDMKINGRRTKTLLYLLRIFCFTGVASFKRRIYFFWRFVWLANCAAVTFWSIYDGTSLPDRKDDSGFELSERKCFICSFLRFRLSGWPSALVTMAGASCQLSREYHPGTKQGQNKIRVRDTEREDWLGPELFMQKDWHHQLDNDNDTFETKTLLYKSRFIYYYLMSSKIFLKCVIFHNFGC